VFTHIPLWSVYPQWGWGTSDSGEALDSLKRFGSVTVLNGHIHQVLQKVEGNVTFHTAMSTAYPQPAPGAAPSPGPLKVPADKLGPYRGVGQVTYVEAPQPVAIVDKPLSACPRLPAVKETIAVLELRLPQTRLSRISRVRSIALAVIGISCGIVLLGGLE